MTKNQLWFPAPSCYTHTTTTTKLYARSTYSLAIFLVVALILFVHRILLLLVPLHWIIYLILFIVEFFENFVVHSNDTVVHNDADVQLPSFIRAILQPNYLKDVKTTLMTDNATFHSKSTTYFHSFMDTLKVRTHTLHIYTHLACRSDLLCSALWFFHQIPSFVCPICLSNRIAHTFPCLMSCSSG